MRVVCGQCGKEFQFETENEVHSLSGDCSNTHIIECPICMDEFGNHSRIIIKTYPIIN